MSETILIQEADSIANMDRYLARAEGAISLHDFYDFTGLSGSRQHQQPGQAGHQTKQGHVTIQSKGQPDDTL